MAKGGAAHLCQESSSSLGCGTTGKMGLALFRLQGECWLLLGKAQSLYIQRLW